MRKRKKVPQRHYGFDVIKDLIGPQLRLRFKAILPSNVTILEEKHVLLVAKVSRVNYIFRLYKTNMLHVVGPLPPVEWEKIVELEKKGHLCLEALVCLVQGIEFDPKARIL